MTTLVMCFAGYAQAWGSHSAFNIRETDREPTKSGTIGLLSNALGYSRSADLSLFEGLRFGVRIDREGRIATDFQVVRKVVKASGESAKNAVVTYREYLEDAVFLVALEGPRNVLERLAEALRHPARPLFLGRIGCDPTKPIFRGIIDSDLEETLKAWPPLVPSTAPDYRFVVEEGPGQGTIRHDMPISFESKRRVYRPRWARTFRAPLTQETRECI